MNSRIKRRFRSYGMSNQEIKESRIENKSLVEKQCKNAIKGCGIPEKYHEVDRHHIDIINKAKRLYLAGKHAGSKSTKLLLQKIKNFEATVAKYTKAVKEAEKLRQEYEKSKEQPVELENVD